MFSVKAHPELRDCVDLIGTPLWIVEISQTQQMEVVSCNELSIAIVNMQMEDESGMNMADIVGKTLDDILPRYLAEQLTDSIDKAIESNAPDTIEITVNHLGVNRWWQCIIKPIAPRENSLKRVLITFIEITEHKALTVALEKANSRFKAIVDTAHDGIVSIDTNETILLANSAAKNIFGNKDLVGQPISSLLPTKFRPKHSGYLQSFEQSKVPSRPMHTRTFVYGLRADGTEVPLEISIARISVDGHTEMTAVIRDATEKNELIRELNHISTIDKLTSLYNRRYTEPLIKTEFERAKRYENPLSLLFIDIDNFKQFNDDYGHSAGDAVLQMVASVMLNSIRDLDTACRWGGEEVLILAPEVDYEHAYQLAERLRIAVQESNFEHKSKRHKVTVSIGVATLTDQITSVDSLIEEADKNMFQAKKAGKNQVCVSSLK